MNNAKAMLLCLSSLVLQLGCAADGLESESDLVAQTNLALTEGDRVVRCFAAELEPEDMEACMDRSGTKVFEVGECKLEIERTCELRETPSGALRCCCRLEVTRTNDACDGVAWQDLFGSP